MAAIRKLKTDRFQLDFSLFGHRIRTNFYDETSAEEFRTRLRLFLEIQKTKLSDAITAYLENETDKRKSQRSRMCERLWFFELKRFLKSKYADSLGEDPFVDRITRLHLEQFQTHLKNNGSAAGNRLSHASINRRFHTYCHFFSKCLEWQLVKADPSIFIRKLPEQINRRSIWSEEDVEAVMAANFIPDIEKEIVLMLLVTGARLGSLLSLKKTDVDFTLGLIKFRQRKGTGQENSYLFPIPSMVSGKLRQRVSASVLKLYTSVDGQKLCAGLISKRFNRYFQKLGRPHLTLHGLRHTFASRLNARGAQIDTVMRLLGHSSVETTKKYLHTTIDDLRRWIS